MLGGYVGKILDVDLSSGKIGRTPLPSEEVLRIFVGNAGLGLHLLAQELKPFMRYTDPKTPILIMTGPLTGTAVPSSSSWCIATLRGLEPYYHPGLGHTHGYFGARLKHSGHDAIVIRGRSKSPVYLWIDDGRAELRDADRLWGQDTLETQRLIQDELGDFENISVACIGPAGEAQLIGASVRNDRAYGVSMSGIGTVWGSKRLKAVAVRGTGKVPIAREEEFMELCDMWTKEVQSPERRRRAVWFDEAGGFKCMPMIGKVGMAPGRNFLTTQWGVGWGERFGEEMKKWQITPVGSYNCSIKCHAEVNITTGPYAGSKYVGFGPESIEGGATIIGVEDPGTSCMMGMFYDLMGACSADSGRMIALAFELYNRGTITEKDTGGLKLEWGNDEAARALFYQMLKREGFGTRLAKEMKAAAKELGPEAERALVHIKGAGSHDHESRAWGVGLLFGTMVSGVGPAWQAYGAEMIPEPDIGYLETQDPATHTKKARTAYDTQRQKMWVDTLGVCWFAFQGIAGNTAYYTPWALNYATGWDDFDKEKALMVGERIIGLQRLISIHLGYKMEYDFDIGERLLKPVPDGPAAGRDVGPYYEEMMKEYYGYLGWDHHTGIPTGEALKKVGLDSYKVGP